MKERKLVRKFTLDTEIYQIELPQKVLEALKKEPLETDPRLYYGMDILFDKAVYQTPDFFQYPLEKLPPTSPSRRSRMTEQDQLRERLSAILDQQLSNVASAVQDMGIDLSHRGIIGDDLGHLHQVCLEFYEEKEKKYDKKGRLKKGMAVSSIMPDRPFIMKKAADLIARMVMEDARREQERATHTPHIIPAGELFTATAKAILMDRRKKAEEDVLALADQLRLQAEIRSDWPLEISSAGKPATLITRDNKIDCPEFLLYHEKTNGSWSMKQTQNLAAAQAEITKRGYNLKTTARMAVLHHLKPVGFSLFSDTPEGLVKIKKQNAAGMNNLNLSWKR